MAGFQAGGGGIGAGGTVVVGVGADESDAGASPQAVVPGVISTVNSRESVCCGLARARAIAVSFQRIVRCLPRVPSELSPPPSLIGLAVENACAIVERRAGEDGLARGTPAS